MIALVPEQPAEGARLATWPDSSYIGKYPPKLYETSLVFDVVGDRFNKNLTLYAGPLEQGKIQRFEPTLEEMMSWGWAIVEPFSKLVFWALVNLHKVIPNYGVVLILFSILIKVIVWPLTAKSYKSMKRMQKLQPLLKTVQDKYKDNPQKMQQEVMALYKEHKVNPMGGCWPTLLQMPLLYGLFMVFRSTIELRGQPFVLWINDLSMPDALFHLPFTLPLYGSHVAVLPIIMAISTWLQSRQTATDPNQKFMTAFMPIMFIFLFNNFPSGLTLYYTLFNILSWGQQKFLKVSDPALEKELEEAAKEKEKQERRDERKRQRQS
jgi:YidC/Oxa1 family membrane protein insertase